VGENQCNSFEAGKWYGWRSGFLHCGGMAVAVMEDELANEVSRCAVRPGFSLRFHIILERFWERDIQGRARHTIEDDSLRKRIQGYCATTLAQSSNASAVDSCADAISI
jgi:hypothetical protein